MAHVRRARGTQSHAAAGRSSTSRRRARLPPEKSIAVLPFLDLTEKKDEAYFADGMTEEITAMVSEASDLKVVGPHIGILFQGSSCSSAGHRPCARRCQRPRGKRP